LEFWSDFTSYVELGDGGGGGGGGGGPNKAKIELVMQ